MRQKVKVDLVEGYRFTVSDMCNDWGESNWEFAFIGELLGDIKKEAVQPIAANKTGSCLASLEQVRYLEYNGEKFVLGESSKVLSSRAHSLLEEIEKSEEYRLYKLKLKEEAVLKKEKEAATASEEDKRREIEEYQRLKKKFEGVEN